MTRKTKKQKLKGGVSKKQQSQKQPRKRKRRARAQKRQLLYSEDEYTFRSKVFIYGQDIKKVGLFNAGELVISPTPEFVFSETFAEDVDQLELFAISQSVSENENVLSEGLDSVQVLSNDLLDEPQVIE